MHKTETNPNKIILEILLYKMKTRKKKSGFRFIFVSQNF